MNSTFSKTLILVVAAVAFVMAGVARAADDIETHDGTTISGTVPFCASWELTEPDVTPFSDVDIVDYDADGFIVSDLIQITDFDCNSKFKITATKSGWTLPADYVAAGAKKADGSDSDLLLMVDNITEGYGSDGMAAQGAFGSFTAVTTTGSIILGGGAVGATAGHGVENAAADVNAKVLMDWSTDIVGAYSVTVTLEIAELTE